MLVTRINGTAFGRGSIKSVLVPGYGWYYGFRALLPFGRGIGCEREGSLSVRCKYKKNPQASALGTFILNMQE